MNAKLNKYFCMLIGAIIMTNITGCSGMKFDRYESKDPLIGVIMDYPSGWQYRETRGSYGSYSQAQFFPDDGKYKGHQPTMVLTVRDESKTGFRPATIETAAEDIMAKRRSFKSMQVLSKSKKRLPGADAIFIEISYLNLENILRADSQLALFNEKIVIFKKDKKFYFLRYENLADRYDEYKKAFDNTVRSIKFKKD